METTRQSYDSSGIGLQRPTVHPDGERVAYCIDRSAFNCGANAKFDMPIVAELCTTLRARGPNAVAVIREEE